MLDKEKKEKYQQEKTKKNNSGLVTDHKESGQKSHTSKTKFKMTLTLV
jgi:hypothetical protein